MRDLLLGIDIGTSACKLAVFDATGRVIAQQTEAYPVYYPQPGWAEQNPEEWWQAICRASKRLFADGPDGQIQPEEIRGIGVDGQSWSAIAVDKTGRVLCNTPIWMDTRAQAECRVLEQALGEETLFAVSGNSVQSMYTMPKVLWYKNHCPEVYQNTYKILQSNSFLVYRLTGALTQDPSQGYGWYCFDERSCQWNTALCQKAGLDPAMLPEILPCHGVAGKITPAAAAAAGLAVGTPVVAGGLDAACGTLGVGVVAPGQTQEQGGQAGGMSICTDAVQADRRLILSAHVVPGRWLLQGGTVAGGAALNWYEKEFGAAERQTAAQNGTSAFYELDAAAEAIPAGSEGVTFLPYLSGERSPIWNPNAKGVFYGIDFSKTRAHFSRAVMEGVAYALRHNLEVAAQAGAEVKELRAMGGAAKSPLWMQIKADVTGKPVRVSSADTATAWGAALLAGVGTGLYPDFETAVAKSVPAGRCYTPNPGNAPAYDRGYHTYRKLYEHLKTMMNEV